MRMYAVEGEASFGGGAALSSESHAHATAAAGGGVEFLKRLCVTSDV